MRCFEPFNNRRWIPNVTTITVGLSQGRDIYHAPAQQVQPLLKSTNFIRPPGSLGYTTEHCRPQIFVENHKHQMTTFCDATLNV